MTLQPLQLHLIDYLKDWHDAVMVIIEVDLLLKQDGVLKCL